MDGPENVILVQDKSIGLKGYLVIDSTVNNSSCGGIRIYPNVTLQEIKDLVRGMTHKQGFVGIPRGGAKGGS
ncbi:MAG: Glu/Leu/Phe/Val dehydrogenase dimerization domain-containing protein [Halobacteriota archaeon]